MQQIATKAGVSKMTVSRALKDHPHLAAKTKNRVQMIARELGYRPHPYISALMSRLAQSSSPISSVNLAVMHFGEEADMRANPLFVGVQTRARELGYAADLFCYDPGTVSPKQLRKILISRGILGIILLPAPAGFAVMDFDFSRFAVAALGHSITTPSLPRVGNDIQAGLFKALDELRIRGYRRIGLINSDHVNALSRFMYSGTLHAYQARFPHDVDLKELRLAQPEAVTSTRRIIGKWIRQKKRDAIISSSFDFPLYEHLQSLGFSIPEELGYLHLLNHPDLTVSSLDVAGQFAGFKAVDLAVAAINRNEFQPLDFPYFIAIEPGWHAGATLRSPAPC